MHRTERYWSVLGLAVFFGVLAVIFTNPEFLLPAAALLAWALASELVFRQRTQRISETLQVSHTVSQPTVRPEQPIDATTAVHLSESVNTPVTVHSNYPAHAIHISGTSEQDLPAGSTDLTLTTEVYFPFAGKYTIGPATVSVSDAYGLFETTITSTDTATVTVDPDEPTDLHVGQAGEQFAVTFGEHGSGNTGPGMVPAGMRAYTPGDPASRINWKATARLDDVYVREFEIETVRPLAILLDTRAPPATTPENDPVEYRRHIGTALVADAASHGDPVGLYTIDNHDVEASQRLSAAPEQYLKLRDRLYTPSQREDTDETDPTTGVRTTPLDIGVAADRLRTDESAFGAQLTPFLRGTASQTRQIEGDPLVQTARTYLKRHGQDVRVAIITGDQHRAELYDTAKLAGQLSPEVLVFITPAVLFEADDITAIDDLYSRYAAFERFRTRLDRLDNVTAFEVAPGAKLQAVITDGVTHAQQ
ncbi:DUF58 domain-containing protein [Halobellus salinus]|uniref:DUF58 domain-containing protein n=1 Tax=Halobellus salinus TaxID=931585 RepID=UPI00166997C6|nr:DUF58 domain-containing protein [Halobellus salinus]